MLAEELERLGASCELAIVGGAAVVLLYGARDATKDIDAVVLSANSSDGVREAITRSAQRLGLPDDWLNDAAKGYVHGLTLGERVFEANSLVVNALAPQQLLAMKLCAWRDDLDIEDARLLMSKLVGGRDEVWHSVEHHLLPGRETKAYFAFCDLWESERGLQ